MQVETIDAGKKRKEAGWPSFSIEKVCSDRRSIKDTRRLVNTCRLTKMKPKILCFAWRLTFVANNRVNLR